MEAASRERVDWPGVVIFFVLACAISWPIFYLARWATDGPSIHPILLTLGFMWGPGLAALILRRRWKRRRRLTLLGSDWKRSLAFYYIPVGALTLAYIPFVGIKALYILAFVGAAGLVVILGEELGWRGYLQDQLRPLGRLPRYMLIGTLWELWHFRFGWVLFADEPITTQIITSTMIRLVITIAVLVALSWIIGEAVERGRAILIAVALHIWVNLPLTGEFQALFQVSPTPLFVVLGLSILFWCYMVWTWPQAPKTRACLGTPPVA